MALSDPKPAYPQIKQRYSEGGVSAFSLNSARTVRESYSYQTQPNKCALSLPDMDVNARSSHNDSLAGSQKKGLMQ